ncbi:MAG: F0F1 ATP synthase subunit delta [Sarcina sp.]
MNSNENTSIKGVVKSVVPLTEKQYQNLLTRLENKYNRKIELAREIDKSIIAGLYIQVGDEFIDATVNTQYKEMKEIMLNRK